MKLKFHQKLVVRRCCQKGRIVRLVAMLFRHCCCKVVWTRLNANESTTQYRLRFAL